MSRRAVVIAVHLGLFLGFGACNVAAARWWAARRPAAVEPVCIGPETAGRLAVYLHGLDGRAPSWQELDGRRALASIPDLRVAVPRAPSCGAGRCWPDADDGVATTMAAIREAASTCFGEPASYGVIGFSRGGFALARVASCDAVGARWAILAAAFGYTDELRLQGCPVAVVIGRRDRHHRDGAVGHAQRRRAAGASGALFEFDGGHRLDIEALRSALDALDREASGR